MAIDDSVYKALAHCAVVLAAGWLVYLKIFRQRHNHTTALSTTAISFVLIALCLLGIPAIDHSALPIGLLCCGLAATGAHTLEFAVGAELATVGVLTYIQTIGSGSSSFTTDYDPTVVTIVGFLFIRLRMSRQSHRRLKSDFKIAEESRVLRERRLRSDFETQVAANLHDLIGHDLTVINIRLQKLARSLARVDMGLSEETRDIQRLARTSVIHLREAVEGLNSVDFSGQLEAMPKLLSYRGIDAHIDIDRGEIANLSPTALSTLQWILLEAITNVLKHSAAQNCSIALTRTDTDGVVLTIADDGIGLRDRKNGRGSGLADIRVRAAQIGGETTVEEASPHGTRVSVTLPARTARIGNARNTTEESTSRRGA